MTQCIPPHKSLIKDYEMAILREMVDRGEIAEISWIPTDKQIANSLTKKGVPSFKILEFISEPKESSV